MGVGGVKLMEWSIPKHALNMLYQSSQLEAIKKHLQKNCSTIVKQHSSNFCEQNGPSDSCSFGQQHYIMLALFRPVMIHETNILCLLVAVYLTQNELHTKIFCIITFNKEVLDSFQLAQKQQVSLLFNSFQLNSLLLESLSL